MAFCSKLGGALRQSLSRNVQSPVTSMLNSIRSMSSSKLFIGGLSFDTDDSSLREAFSGYGEVTESRVIVDRETGRSRGFGFVSYTDEEAAGSAMSAMDGKDLHGRMVRVSYATERVPRSGGYGGGGGGYGGGGGGYGGGGGGRGGGGDFGGDF